mmetsp:Transcript_54789/g.102732  ORF Transcript_54789/g.102732 Transcript_54789/m.102732 type:complete len:601 (+) Transcript_54789:74-1876(+)
MRLVAVLLACAFCSGHGRRGSQTLEQLLDYSQEPHHNSRESPDELNWLQSQWRGAASNPLKVLATLFLSPSASAGWQVAGLGQGRRLLPCAARGPSCVSASATATSAVDEDAAALVKLLSATDETARGATLSVSDTADVHRLATSLESAFLKSDPADTNESPLIPGRWRVLYQGKPGGEKTEFFSIESWRKYIAGDGPSPIQNLVSGSSSVNRLYQVVQFDGPDSGRINNVVDLSPAAVIAIEADLDGKPQRNRLGFRFTGGKILLRTIWNGTLSLPYPVPFDLLGDNAKGWLQTDYLTEKLRLSRGNKGSLFVLTPEPEPDDPELEAYLDPPPEKAPAPPASTLVRDPVIICPAQFGTLSNYEDLVESLQARGHPVIVAPLKFTDWFRLIPASLTPEYWKGELSPDVALPFYYEAIDKAVDMMKQQYPGKKIQLVAHSIGGWITRAYLGRMSDDERAATFSALVTLGTPHKPPPEGFLRTIDQTRGLLTYVEDRYPGAFHKELRYLTVCSKAQRGALPGSGAGLIAGSLALASYLPLGGDGFAEGDGITPLKCGHLEGAEQRDVNAYHIAFIPGSGTRLLGTPWYGSPEVIDGWADFLQ